MAEKISRTCRSEYGLRTTATKDRPNIRALSLLDQHKTNQHHTNQDLKNQQQGIHNSETSSHRMGSLTNLNEFRSL